MTKKHPCPACDGSGDFELPRVEGATNIWAGISSTGRFVIGGELEVKGVPSGGYDKTGNWTLATTHGTQDLPYSVEVRRERIRFGLNLYRKERR